VPIAGQLLTVREGVAKMCCSVEEPETGLGGGGG